MPAHSSHTKLYYIYIKQGNRACCCLFFISFVCILIFGRVHWHFYGFKICLVESRNQTAAVVPFLMSSTVILRFYVYSATHPNLNSITHNHFLSFCIKWIAAGTDTYYVYKRRYRPTTRVGYSFLTMWPNECVYTYHTNTFFFTRNIKYLLVSSPPLKYYSTNSKYIAI